MYFLESVDQRGKEEKENKQRRRIDSPIPNLQYNDANNNEIKATTENNKKLKTCFAYLTTLSKGADMFS